MLYHLMDQEPTYSFGLGCDPQHLYHPTRQNSMHKTVWPSPYIHPLGVNYHPHKSLEMEKPIHIGKHGFQVSLDVQHFAPNEITVKTVENDIVVEGKHDEKEDNHGHIFRHFKRRYTLPKEFDLKDVVTTLSSDGFLTIKAPPINKALASNERVIQIHHTGPAHLTVKKNVEEEEKKLNGIKN